MGSYREQRPPSLSSHLFPPPIPAFEVLGRPIDPQPAPLIHINGSPGVGKETVAELLTFILGDDKSMLIDVRSLGFEGDTNGVHAHKHLLTPEHPCYFSFDVGMEIFDESTTVNWEGSNKEKKVEQVEDKTPENPCITDNLTRLLLKPSNAARAVLLPAFAPDTVVGRAFVKTLEEAAENTGRLFIPVTLDCASPERIRRTMSLQRQCSYKIRRPSEPALSKCEQVFAPQPVGPVENEVCSRRLAISNYSGLVLDITSANTFAAALQIVDYVKRCRAEKDKDWRNSNSAATTPTGSVGGEKNVKTSG
ncbi:hypothetical protein QC763_101838 [Podospora pseudopauciseta]|uniref:Uncharacterized protein n=1 Tax=Podospora pseudopauciseta TaxID=2093780 RepID=A0ABR0HW14_9PEZI|nr:hypothetical protein QC763_101838 [Podospora pseudopauciseta]